MYSYIKNFICFILLTGSLSLFGQVGIGTTSPAEELDVVGDIQFSGEIKPSGSSGTAGQMLMSAGVGNSTVWGASIIYLSMPKISTIKASSGSEVNATNTLKVNDLLVDSSSGSDVDLRVEANSIESESSSGSEIDLKGTCVTLSADSSSGSQIDADELKAETVIAEASSGADINVYASKSITAKASSGGSIDCAGNPNQKNLKKSSGGDVDIY